MIHQQPAYSAGKDDTRNAELKSYDNDLNALYKKIMSQLKEKDKTNLRQAQRAWIKMRDSDCQWAFVDNRDCLIDRTINRIEELSKTWFYTKEGQYINNE